MDEEKEQPENFQAVMTLRLDSKTMSDLRLICDLQESSVSKVVRNLIDGYVESMMRQEAFKTSLQARIEEDQAILKRLEQM